MAPAAERRAEHSQRNVRSRAGDPVPQEQRGDPTGIDLVFADQEMRVETADGLLEPFGHHRGMGLEKEREPAEIVDLLHVLDARVELFVGLLPRHDEIA